MQNERLPIKEKIRQYRWAFEGRSIPMGIGCAWVSAEENEKENLKILCKSYETGFRYYDTSRRYGESELMVGRFLREIDRKTIFLATKAGFRPQDADGFENFKRDFYESFTRLGVDYIDLYQIHDTENYDLCVPEVIPFLKERRKEGMIGYIGLGTRSLVSHCQGVACGDLESSLSYMDYNLLKLSALPLIELARQHGTAFVNASVLLFGLIKNPDPLAIDPPAYGPKLLHRQFAKKMQELCRNIGIDIVAASLQFSLFNPDIDMTLNGLRRMSNLESTINAMRARIEPEQWAAITELQRTHPNIRIPDERNY
ncbi:MAG: aldo/keto reductase [Spirochaetaceae bacterium]|jgi:D-threo-aldose 1-dehydrogenase|nr:aldo/keto reductase [Spirochaetaceae bacterium]